MPNRPISWRDPFNDGEIPILYHYHIVGYKHHLYPHFIPNLIGSPFLNPMSAG